MLGSLSQTNTIPLLSLLFGARVLETPKLGAHVWSARTFIIGVHDSDAWICYNSHYFIILNGLHTGPWTGKSLNLDSRGLEIPGIFVEVLESPGIWTYRSIFLIISIQEFSHYTSFEVWALKVCEFIEKVLEFDMESPGIWDVKMCMNPATELLR